MAMELHPLLEPYYKETDPEIRKNKLDAFSGQSDTPADQYRKSLFCRHYLYTLFGNRVVQAYCDMVVARV